jgi:cyclase
VTRGRVVKGVRFEGLRDAGDPVELGRLYAREGADELLFLDISATREARRTAVALAEAVASELFIPFTVGGGLRSVSEMREVLHAGADKVAVNTEAVRRPELITEAAESFGTQAVVVAIDAFRSGSGWRVRVRAGTEETPLDAVAWALRAAELGAGEILLTSIDRDGTRDGYDLELVAAVCDAVRVPVIASGGAGRPEHFAGAFEAGAGAALALRRALADAGVVPEAIDYVNAHGTGTVQNDPAELAALVTVFGPEARQLPISSTKAMLGHALGASGAAEVVICALAQREQHSDAHHRDVHLLTGGVAHVGAAAVGRQRGNA